jgi:rubrerythrin
MKNFNELSERLILALAISLEEEDERVYADFFEGLRQDFAASAAVFDSMRKEESEHRRRLIELYRQKFGEHIPLIRRQDVKGFVQRTPVWLVRPLGLDTVRKQASAIEVETRKFYERAAVRAQDASIRQLLDDLGQDERAHEDQAQEPTEEKLRPDVKEDEDRARRRLLCCKSCNPASLDQWMAQYQLWPRYLQQPWPRRTAGTPSSSGWRHRWEPASAWALQRRCPMTGASRGAGIRGYAA